MVVVDTNILAYLLIEGDRSADAQALWRRDADWRSEGFILVEFSNILATYLRAKALSIDEAMTMLGEASRRLAQTTDVPHADALSSAAAHGVSAYDARFLAAAAYWGVPLTTEDVRLRAAAPALTQSLADAVAG